MLARLLARLPLAILYTAAGVGHFTDFESFMVLMHKLPLPWAHASAVYVTGVAELIGGIALLASPSEHVCTSLFWLTILMTPANINMWYNDLAFKGHRLSSTGHALRAFTQVVLLLWLRKLASFYSKNSSDGKDK